MPPGSFFHNPYNLALFPAAQDNTNPFAGQPVFSGYGGEWGTSLVHLGALVAGGEAFQLRFVLGKDKCVGVDGWYVESVRVYDCQGSEDCNTNGVPDDVETAGGGRPDMIASHPTSHDVGFPSDAEPTSGAVEVQAQRLALLVPKTVHSLRLWGHYNSSDSEIFDDVTVVFHEEDPDTGLPGPVISTQTSVPVFRSRTGLTVGEFFDEWQFSLQLEEPMVLAPGAYWIEVFDHTNGDDATFSWSTSGTTASLETGAATAGQAPGQTWQAAGPFDMAIDIEAGFSGADCNRNQVPDSCDIVTGHLGDRDEDGVADICEPRRPRRRVRP